MIGYYLQKWAYAKKFEANEGGHLYRKQRWAPAFQLSEDEHREVMQDFKRRYWRWFVFSLLAIFGAIILLVVLTWAMSVIFDDLPESFLTIVANIVFIPLLTFMIIDHIRAQHRIVEAVLGDRQPALPARGWKAVQVEHAQKRSWPVHIIWSACNAGLFWLFMPQQTDAPPIAFLLAAIFALGFFISVWSAWLKYSHP